VIASQSLFTWAVTGEDLAALTPRLRALPEVEQVSAFGSALHVTGTDHERMKADLAPLMAEPGREWQEVEPGLEDVFIHLMMRGAGETTAADGRKSD
jgi:ABC-2 type transport system ATP-binding protein